MLGRRGQDWVEKDGQDVEGLEFNNTSLRSKQPA